ncbi:hypothetical protein F511_08707 [Dorcoceras hygrometricum]|uniref:Uncharacterized protein n=1 Tax=Dorcoceras hygrometricum TaxID=472368 RepID=A0A2Z7CXX5_9LAMI|nr:hypothetical protein F511_08707 [Dorcoceras hygrometricum]
MAPSAPRTRAAAALRMKQIAGLQEANNSPAPFDGDWEEEPEEEPEEEEIEDIPLGEGEIDDE